MEIRISINKSLAILLLLIAICSCSSFNKNIANDTAYPPREKACELRYLTKLPDSDTNYTVLGECVGKGMKGIITSEYQVAHKRIEECACKNGANAIVIDKSFTKGGTDQYGRYTQYYAVVNATAIYIIE
jgi:hypothetical protein